MINANELRLNNWILDEENNPFQVTSAFYQFLEINSEICKPIELTEEILLKCGFEKKEEKVYVNKNITIYKFGDLYWFDLQNEAIYILTLNQLQNLYFALTNKELIYTP
jgi:hypothetical protein